MPQYNKPVITLNDQIALLRRRGMIIPSPKKARAVLQMLNFYRFNGYALVYASPGGARPQQFVVGTRFGDVVKRIEFDRALRAHVMAAIDQIEVAVRSVITSEAALHYSEPHWFLNISRFNSHKEHARFVGKWVNEYARSDETFAKHYRMRYTEPFLPPAWVIAELTSLGTWSMLYKCLVDRAVKLRISQVFNLSPDTFASNLHALTYLRNLCAHHARVYNRVFTVKPSLAQRTGNRIPLPQDTMFSAQAGVIRVMLEVIAPRSTWVRDLRRLILKHGILDSDLGFPVHWERHPFWGL
jgi:abortive infection bacteriophage resistance protein